MKRSVIVTSVLFAASVLLSPCARAAGLIVVDPISGVAPPRAVTLPPRPGHPPTPRPVRPVLRGSVSFGLRLQGADIKVDISDQVAKTYITQTFVNDTDSNLAGTYLFPLPEDTTFSSFSLHIDGKPVEGKILEAQEARQQYEEIVRRMVDPGLLEYADYKTVRARIFPIPAHGTKKVELEYTQVLRAENGMLKYRFPLKTEGETSPADEVKVNVKLNSKMGLRTIWSPSHTITSTREGDHSARISYLGKDTVPDKDFLLYFSVSDKDMSANLLTHKNTGEDGYYLLTLTPPVASKEVIGKDIVLVADTSGSMQGERLSENKKALKYLVNALTAADRFSIVEFNTDVESYKTQLVPATAENKKAALSFINDLEARGGTNIGDALKTATTMLDHASDRPGYLVLMTDGEPTVGETTVPGLLKTVVARRDIRVFDFGVGYDVNTRLLNKLAESHHGTSQYVEPDESIETALSSFYEKIKTPVLSNVKISYNGIQAKDVYPREVKDIFAGSQVLLIGRYKGSGNGSVQLTGTVNGVAKAYSFPLSFAAQEVGHTYLPRLWAMRRIGHLSEVAQDNGNNKEVVDEIVALSKKYGIISAYTSFLVTDPSENHRLPVGMPVPMARPMEELSVRSSSSAAPTVSPMVLGGAAHGMVMPSSSFQARRQAQAIDDKVAYSVPAAPSGRLLNKSKLVAADGLYGMSAGSAGGSGGYGLRSLHSGEKESAADFWSAPQAEAQLKNEMAKAYNAPAAGKDAVLRAKKLDRFKEITAEASESNAKVKTVDDKTFYLRGGFWTDGSLDPQKSARPEVITFGSKQYFDLIKFQPGISKYLAVGRQVIFMYDGHCYKIIFTEIS